MRRLGAWFVPRLGTLLVAGAAWVTLVDGPKLVAPALLFSGIAVDGVRFARKRFKRRRSPSLDPFGNPIRVEAGRAQRPS